MNQKDYDRMIELVNVGGGWTPANTNAEELLDQCGKGEIITLLEVGARDLKFHRCYFSLLAFIYDYLPLSFKKAVPKNKFYLWLKHLKGEYNVIFTFKDGTKLIEYDSIAFGSMSQKRFETYIKEQLPWIYENVIGTYFQGEIYNGIINTIETEFAKYLAKLS
jgi:hypothetical protein